MARGAACGTKPASLIERLLQQPHRFGVTSLIAAQHAELHQGCGRLRIRPLQHPRLAEAHLQKLVRFIQIFQLEVRGAQRGIDFRLRLRVLVESSHACRAALENRQQCQILRRSRTIAHEAEHELLNAPRAGRFSQSSIALMRQSQREECNKARDEDKYQHSNNASAPIAPEKLAGAVLPTIRPSRKCFAVQEREDILHQRIDSRVAPFRFFLHGLQAHHVKIGPLGLARQNNRETLASLRGRRGRLLLRNQPFRLGELWRPPGQRAGCR